MQALAAARGGRCLSEHYTSMPTHMLWECARGHTWQSTPNLVTRGAWCRQCHNEDHGRTLKAMQELAASRGGRCLSARYITSHTKLQWECAQGHTWQAAPSSLTSGGRWCPVCSWNRAGLRRRSTIEQMQALAASRGGHCLSERYTSTDTKLQWECARGHTWWARPGGVAGGTWCPQCAILDRTRNPDKRRKYLAGKE
jgi:hypothetical protein